MIAESGAFVLTQFTEPCLNIKNDPSNLERALYHRATQPLRFDGSLYSLQKRHNIYLSSATVDSHYSLPALAVVVEPSRQRNPYTLPEPEEKTPRPGMQSANRRKTRETEGCCREGDGWM